MFVQHMLENEIRDLIVRSCLGISDDVRGLMEKALSGRRMPAPEA